MAHVQKQFKEFHDTIKLDDENDTLREKRDIILNRLKKNISKDAKSYTVFIQGSYAMSTGIKPLDGEYDIDVGLWFDMSTNDAKPVEAKNWVYDALKNHTDEVVIKTPCVTVTYKENGKPSFHIDLTTYSTTNNDGYIYLAKGKPTSKEENKVWQKSDPKQLTKIIKDHLTDSEDRAQFRRVVRYMKRWKDIKFTSGGHSKPTGIALTIAAKNYSSPRWEITDRFANTKEYRDLKCLINFVSNLISGFTYVSGENGTLVQRLIIKVPTPSYEDLFEKMTDNQMNNFKEKLESLLDKLSEADNEVDPVKACELLQKEFGTDFPVPSKETTGSKQRKSVATESSSAKNLRGI
jgi:hypothetical protein